ncbi:hypothetical protein F01_500057 [Burkholderia cenocepacia]|nr:hypothetical protein F01_500057 [Burkholderia cenocepacia]
MPAAREAPAGRADDGRQGALRSGRAGCVAGVAAKAGPRAQAAGASLRDVDAGADRGRDRLVAVTHTTCAGRHRALPLAMPKTQGNNHSYASDQSNPLPGNRLGGHAGRTLARCIGGHGRAGGARRYGASHS